MKGGTTSTYVKVSVQDLYIRPNSTESTGTLPGACWTFLGLEALVTGVTQYPTGFTCTLDPVAVVVGNVSNMLCAHTGERQIVYVQGNVGAKTLSISATYNFQLIPKAETAR